MKPAVPAKLPDWTPASMRIVRICLAVFLIFSATQLQAAEKIGVVLLHGKEGSPDRLEPLAGSFNQQGFDTERPEMCWSWRRIYDKPYLDCIAEIDAAVEKLKTRGAQGIVVLGISLGGNAALAYGARREGLRGIVAVVPAHAPEFIASAVPDIGNSLAEAKTLIATGRGDEKILLADRNTGKPHFLVMTTPNIYVTFFGPDSPGVMPDNSTKLKAPLLVLTGTWDPTQRSIPYVFSRAPNNPMNRYIAVQADHLGTMRMGRKAVFSWLKELTED